MSLTQIQKGMIANGAVIVPSNLATTGTASSSTVLAGDGSWILPVDPNKSYTVTNFTVNGTLLSNSTATFDGVATFNDQLIVIGPATIVGATHIQNNSLTVDNNLSVGGNLNVGGGSTGSGLTINSTSTFNGKVYFNSSTYFTAPIVGAIVANGTSTFNAPVFFNSSATFNGSIFGVSNLTVANLTATNSITAGGIQFPNNPGTYGQVLATNGLNTATWVNLGSLNFWSLSTDLETNGFNIVTGGLGANLTIGVGTETNFTNGSSSFIDLTNSNLSLSAPNPIGVYPGIQFPDGSIQYTAGGGGSGTSVTGVSRIIAGSNVTISPTSGTGTVTINASTFTTYGVQQIVAGANITISGTTGPGEGVVTITGVANSYSAGTAISIVNGTISALEASNSNLGVVKPDGTSITINNGIISSNSTNTNAGIVSLARDEYTNGYAIRYNASATSNITLDNSNNINFTGQVIFNTGLYSPGNISSNAQIEAYNLVATNGLTVYNGPINLTAFGSTASAQVNIASSNISITGTNIVISASSLTFTATNLLFESADVIIGTNASNSTLQVEKIYNYDGTSAPNFPAGIQFGDQTIQVTAFQGYDQGNFNLV